MVKIARICVLGGEKVGKTGIIHQLAYGRDVTSNAYEPTLEDTYTLNIDVDKACLIILDTSGADLKTNLEIKRSYLQLCDGYIFVYSIDNPESFTILTQLKALIDKNAKDKKEVPIVVLANKKDLGQINAAYKRVDSNMASNWCSKEKIKFYETSVKDRLSLVEPMAFLCSKLFTVQKEPKFTLTKRLKEKQSGPAIMMDL